MRCYCCDCELSDYEATIKSEVTGQYLDCCNTCLKESGVFYVSKQEMDSFEGEKSDDSEY